MSFVCTVALTGSLPVAAKYDGVTQTHCASVCSGPASTQGDNDVLVQGLAALDGLDVSAEQPPLTDDATIIIVERFNINVVSGWSLKC